MLSFAKIAVDPELRQIVLIFVAMETPIGHLDRWNNEDVDDDHRKLELR